MCVRINLKFASYNAISGFVPDYNRIVTLHRYTFPNNAETGSMKFN